jgi:hypothetical protein
LFFLRFVAFRDVPRIVERLQLGALFGLLLHAITQIQADGDRGARCVNRGWIAQAAVAHGDGLSIRTMIARLKEDSADQLASALVSLSSALDSSKTQ